MDELTFVSNLIRDLVWPVAMLVAFLIAIYHAPKLARFVKAVRYKGFEVTMREELIEARADVDQLKLEVGDAGANTLNPKDKIIQLANIDRGIAIVEVWRKLEDEVIRLIQHSGLMRFTRPVPFVEHLASLGKISERELNLFHKLRKIRNDSVHMHDTTALTMAEVIEFRDFVEVLARRFEQIKSEPDYIDLPKEP